MPHYGFCGGAKEYASEARSSMRGEHDQVRTLFFSYANDFRSRFAVDPKARVAVAMCANQPSLLPDDHGLGLLAAWTSRLGR